MTVGCRPDVLRSRTFFRGNLWGVFLRTRPVKARVRSDIYIALPLAHRPQMAGVEAFEEQPIFRRRTTQVSFCLCLMRHCCRPVHPPPTPRAENDGSANVSGQDKIRTRIR